MEDIEAHLRSDKATFNTLSFGFPAFLISRMLFVNYYKDWLAKNKSAYKSGWIPVSHLTFVSNDSIPGTSWLPTIGLIGEASSKTITVQKKKWGFGKHKLRTADAQKAEAPLQSPTSPLSPNKTRRKPAVATDEDSSIASDSSSLRLVSAISKSVPIFRLEIPGVVDTLTSTVLRRLFYVTFLEYRFGDAEKKLYNALSKFQADYVAYSDSDVVQHQKEIREAASKILEEYADIPDREILQTVISDGKVIITSKFFLDSEVKLYNLFHNHFQSFLANNQWIQA